MRVGAAVFGVFVNRLVWPKEFYWNPFGVRPFLVVFADCLLFLNSQKTSHSFADSINLAVLLAIKNKPCCFRFFYENYVEL